MKSLFTRYKYVFLIISLTILTSHLFLSISTLDINHIDCSEEDCLICLHEHYAKSSKHMVPLKENFYRDLIDYFKYKNLNAVSFKNIEVLTTLVEFKIRMNN